MGWDHTRGKNKNDMKYLDIYLIFFLLDNFNFSPTNNTLSTFDDDIESLLLVKVKPSFEKTLSASVEVAGTQRYFLTRRINIGYWNLLSFHHSKTSSSLSNSGSFL